MRYFLVGITGSISMYDTPEYENGLIGPPYYKTVSHIIGLYFQKFPNREMLLKKSKEFIIDNLKNYVNTETTMQHSVHLEVISLTEVSEIDYKTFFNEK